MGRTLSEYLAMASELLDAGDAVKAGQIWQAILKRNPSNAEAKAGMLKVMEALKVGHGTGAPVFEIPVQEAHTPDQLLSESMTTQSEAAPSDSWIEAPVQSSMEQNENETGSYLTDSGKIGELVASGTNAYELGNYETAIEVWTKALSLEPYNDLVKGYIDLARGDLARIEANPAPKSPVEEAIPEETPMMVSSSAKQLDRILLAMPAIAPKNEQSPSSGKSEVSDRENADISTHQAASVTQIPDSITQGRASQRSGVVLLKEFLGHPVAQALSRPRNLAILFSGILLLVLGTLWFAVSKKDTMLKATQESIRESAITTANRAIKQPQKLILTFSALVSQAKSAMTDNPLRAYLLAQEALNLKAEDAQAAKLMEEAMHAMSALPKPEALGGKVEQHIANGNLDGARALLEARLRQNPDDKTSREQLAMVSLSIARIKAGQGKFEMARSSLLMGAALFPKDLAWQGRLKLLAYLQSAQERERLCWVEMLG